MRSALLVLLLCSIGSAATRSVNVSTVSGVESVALNNAAFSTSGASSQRWEMRLHDASAIPDGYAMYLGPFAILFTGGNVFLTNAVNPPVTDTLINPQPSTVACCSGITDVSIRVMRDVPNLAYTFQLCVTATGVCQTQTSTISLLGNTSGYSGSTTANDWKVLPFNFSYGYKFAWIRWFSTLTDPANIILNTNTADVADWEFENSLVDSVHGLTFSGSTVAYSDTPVYSPVCLPFTQQTFKVSTGGTVTAANLCQPLDGGATLTPLWTYNGTGADGITQSTISFGTAGAISTTVGGLAKGSVNLNLAVTDGSSNTTNTVVHDGAVDVGLDDVVITHLSSPQDSILGPMLRWGSSRNRVPWFDDRNKALLDLQGAALSTNFPVYWDSFVTGTISVSPTQTCGGSMAGYGLIGTGTNFTSFASNDYLIIAWGGGNDRFLQTIGTIVSDTCIITTYPWAVSTESGIQMAKATPAQLGYWFYGQAATPGNYYDNVKAYRAFYERSGIDTYWTYYTTLADNFWRNPAMDQGNAFVVGNQYQFPYTNRSQSLEGMYLRAFDSGKSAMLTGLDIIVGADSYEMTNNLPLYGWALSDTRVQAYSLEFAALGANYSANPTSVASYKAAINTAIPLYLSGIQANGNIPVNDLGTTNVTDAVNVTNGSTNVTCRTANCGFTTEFVGPGLGHASFATYTPAGAIPGTNAGYSSLYYPTRVSATQLTLDRAYSEASSVGGNTGFAWAGASYLTGWGSQPFMVGIQTTALYWAADAITGANKAVATAVAQSDVTWLTTRGYADPAHGGLGGAYYYQDFIACSFPIQTASCTLGFDQTQSRTDAAEMIRGLANDYIRSPTPTKKAFLATLIDQMWCKPGFIGAGTTCTSDGYYISDMDNGQTFMSSNGLANKWLGFFFGWSAIQNAIAEVGPGETPTPPIFPLLLAAGGPH